MPALRLIVGADVSAQAEPLVHRGTADAELSADENKSFKPSRSTIAIARDEQIPESTDKARAPFSFLACSPAPEVRKNPCRWRQPPVAGSLASPGPTGRHLQIQRENGVDAGRL